MSEPAFRFGYQLRGGRVDDVLGNAVAAEAAGFDVLHSADHVNEDWPPLPPLAAAAAVTEHIRLCPLVVNNDFRHPVHLARDVAALDHFSGGRVELGLGAGHAFTEYEALGTQFDPPGTRKARLAEAVEILRQLFDGETVTFRGDHYELHGVRTMPSRQLHLPILVGVNGQQALRHAARHADTVGLTMLGRTLGDGQRHETRWEPERLDRTIAFIQQHAHDRTQPLELHALVQAVIITDDAEAAAAEMARSGRTTSSSDALTTPFLAIGTHEEIAEHLLACRARWGISYFSVRDIERFAPVIDRLRGR